MVVDMGYWTKVCKRLLVLLLTILGIYLSFKLAMFYIPFLIAFIVSLLVEPIIRYIAKKSKLTRKASAIIVLAIVSIIIICLLTFGIMSIITESSNLLQGLNGYIEKAYDRVQEVIGNIQFDKIKIAGAFSEILNTSAQDVIAIVSSWLRNFLNGLLQIITAIPTIAIYIFITLLSTYFICADKLYILDQLEHHLPKTWVKRLMLHLRKLINSLGAYLKAEIILVIIAFIITLLGMFLMNLMGLNVAYPLLAALAIGFVDALPILGSGTVIVPWAIISAIDGDIRISNSITHTICNNINNKTNNRTKNSKQTNRNTPNIHTNSNVYRL